MKMTIIGMGYLGATHAACMAELGHEVLGVETDVNRLRAIAAGSVPFYEPGLSELLAKHFASGRLRVTDSYSEAASWANVIFLAVGTPQKRGDNSADLSHVYAAVESLLPLLAKDSVILGKSTVPVGTCEQLADRANDLAKESVNVEVAWNPEFLREGHAIDDTLHPDRIVIGMSDGGSADAVAREIYHVAIAAGTPYLVMDTASAEMVKVAANAFLATKISFINAIADVCQASGANVSKIADALGHDDRIGRKFLNAGIGFGGGCLPKDIRAFIARAGELGVGDSVAFLREVDLLNMRRRTRIVDSARQLCDGRLLNKRVAVLGAAFKPDSDDVRDSPALNIAGQLQLQGAQVSVYDPKAIDNSRSIFPTLDYQTNILSACEDADLTLVLTEWREFVEFDPQKIASVVRTPTVVDGRLCLPRASWEAAGWRVVQ